MSQTPAVFANFSDAACVLTLVVRAYHDEKGGQVKMTADTIHPAVRSYLARKGFIDNEDVRRLEE
jgi:hypothetical protein